MASEAERWYSEEQCRWHPRRDRETGTVYSVCIHLPSLGSKSILYRSLEAIQQQSQELQRKGRITRILDKTQDSQKVAKIVEDLRQATIIYQVGASHSHDNHAMLTWLKHLSQQQSIDNQVTQLTVRSHILSLLLKLTYCQLD